MKWSTKAWKASEAIYQSITELAFIEELMNGKLPEEKFQFYMLQDSHYLEHFGRALALIGGRAHDTQDMLAFVRFSEGAIVVESALHQFYTDPEQADQSTIEPACHHYIHYLKSTAATEQVEVAMAAVLPCFWIYKAVGDYIYQNQEASNNPYQKWIDTYAGEEFGVLVKQAIDICDKVAAECTPAQQAKMTEAFITASRMEKIFWEGAYDIRKW
ncbi:thiaminase II [Flammeovirgaceae bacterium SG7u.111]|nr:thiaminase II [Flammeovirgaceae bacterium SG7u.132]WPO37659.1 thiaminase II [Flammeovirgaceae bacterium SG7u.111]